MAVAYNPPIVTNGLILNIDAANIGKLASSKNSTNIIQNGAFLNGNGSPQNNPATNNPTNLITVFPNPGDTNYVLRQNGTNAEYELQVTSGMLASTTYVMSGWYAKSSDYNGTDTMFHSVAVSSSGANSGTGLGTGTEIATRIINGITWSYRYQTITTPADFNNLFYWYVGYGATNTAGFRYYTNLKLEKGTFPVLPDLSNSSNIPVLVNPTYNLSTKALSFTTSSTMSIPTINLASSNHTVMYLSRLTGTTNRRVLTAVSNNWLLGYWNGSSSQYYSEGWITPAGGTAVDTSWAVYTGTGNVAGDQYSLWKNNVKLYTNSTAGSAGPNGLSINTGAYVEASTCEISVILAYNRVLSDAEVLQNYNALRGRYSL